MKEKPSGEEMNTRLKDLQKKLAAQTLAVREHKLPVIVLVEGWGTSGKGSLVGRIINNIDPRFYRVASLEKVRGQAETISLAICKRDTGSRQFCLYGFRLDGSAYA